MGPAFIFPTATEDKWASDKWSGGVGVVVLTMPGSWVLGVLVQNVWSFAGDDDAAEVNQFLFQPIINYNMNKGWYLT
ncbi:MAG: neuromedin U, partial [Thermoanaerobaculia bacterium]